MRFPGRWVCLPIAAMLAGAAAPAHAQEALPKNVVSANPFGLLLEFFNAEYERAITSSSTAGVGGSYISSEGEDYSNADVFWRFYPGGEPLDGWAFGAKVGVTDVAEQGTYFGYGFDVNRSWLLSQQNNFYVGIGFGLKRLVGADEEVELAFIPTIRIVNVGFAF